VEYAVKAWGVGRVRNVVSGIGLKNKRLNPQHSWAHKMARCRVLGRACKIHLVLKPQSCSRYRGTGYLV
jgi:hypothetical protein